MISSSLSADGLRRRWRRPPEELFAGGAEPATTDRNSKSGKLNLTAARGEDGLTRLERAESENPLAIQRRIPSESSGEPPRVCVLTPGGGLLGGDRYERSIHGRRGSYLRVEDTGLQRVYGMGAEGYCRQETTVTVESGACLEWIPGPIIPYADGRLHEFVHLELQDDAALFVPFVFLPGRLAHGEDGDYDYYGQRVVGRNPSKDRNDGPLSDLRFADSFTVGTSVDSTPDETIATIYLLLENDERHPKLIEHLRSAFEGIPAVRGGVSLLGDDRTVVAHLSSDDWQAVLEYVRESYVQFRKEMKFSEDPEPFLFTAAP